MDISTDKIYCGDVLTILKTWPDELVQCVVTSPPYWGLRDYGHDSQIGLESAPDVYVQKIVEVFRHVRRILKKDGTAWINLGDSYIGSGKGRDSDHGKAVFTDDDIQASAECPEGFKRKDMVGIPWRVALALQADGWYLRADIIWAKPNPMPESVTDRPTKAHEYIFLLSKAERYFYDHEAIKEGRVTFENRPDGCDRHREFGYDSKYRTMEGSKQNFKIPASDKQRGHSRRHDGFNDRWDHMTKEEQTENGRNKRSVWTIATYPFTEAHFATFPEDIPTICIKAGSKPGDIILDPFMGSGTTGLVAKRFKRKYLGIELNQEYVRMAEKRIAREQEPLLTE